jgi:hypothetical protein
VGVQLAVSQEGLSSMELVSCYDDSYVEIFIHRTNIPLGLCNESHSFLLHFRTKLIVYIAKIN